MLALLASVLLAVTPAKAPPSLPDTEVPRYLRGGELAQWSRARVDFDNGQAEYDKGISIISMPRAPLKGAGFETPEQAKARGEAMKAAGQAKRDRARETLDRLRYVAAARFADMTKSVSETVEISGYAWSEGLLVTSLRAQKVARDAGMTSQHVLGAWGFGADGKAAANADLGDDLRAAWTKAQGDRALLQPVPAAGYRISAPTGAAAPPAFAADWAAPTAPNQVALVWAEVYPVGPAASLVFVRVADAHSLRIVASECFVTAGRNSAAIARASVTLRDEHSFLPRAGASGAWRIGYPREACHPLGSALLRHLALRGDGLAAFAGETLSELLPAAAPLTDRPNALWQVRAVPGAAGDFRIACQQVGAKTATDVGVLSFKLDAEKPAEPAKPAGK